MKAYLNEFFSTCSYTDDDAAYLLGVYDRITADAIACDCFDKAVAEYKKETCDYARLIALADEAAGTVDVHEYTAELLVYMCLSKALRERYRARGIDDEIFWNSMLDLRYKLEECKTVKGVVGSFVATWFEGFFAMTRFALGRLQFELVPFGHHYEKDGKTLTPDSNVINVHIPRTGTPLDADECERAYARAAAFLPIRSTVISRLFANRGFFIPKMSIFCPSVATLCAL